jgi:hypothetical protein
LEEKYEQNNLDEQVQDESFTEQPLPQIAVEQIDDQSKLSEVYVGKITSLRFHPFFLTTARCICNMKMISYFYRRDQGEVECVATKI